MLGIVVEYFPNAEPLSQSNITFALAENAMRSMIYIHGCHVMHADIDNDCDAVFRNCLVTAEGRIVWIDFDRSCTPGSRGVSFGHGPTLRVDFWFEISALWHKLYNVMVSFRSRYGSGPF